ncbi:hypothetical protein V8C35DRAFT_289196 [Trichoderma chlorosporum]
MRMHSYCYRGAQILLLLLLPLILWPCSSLSLAWGSCSVRTQHKGAMAQTWAPNPPNANGPQDEHLLCWGLRQTLFPLRVPLRRGLKKSKTAIHTGD